MSRAGGSWFVIGAIVLTGVAVFGSIELVQRYRIARMRDELPKVLDEIPTQIRIVRDERGLRLAKPDENEYGFLANSGHTAASTGEQEIIDFAVSGRWARSNSIGHVFEDFLVWVDVYRVAFFLTSKVRLIWRDSCDPELSGELERRFLAHGIRTVTVYSGR